MRLALDSLGAVTDLASGKRRDGGWLVDGAARRAAVLTRVGVGPGSNVILAHGNSAAFVADLFAVWWAGATAAVVSPALTRSELENLIDFAAARATLVASDWSHGGGLTPVPLCLEEEAAGAEPAAPADLAPEAPALILFTSGTTGTPKGVVLSFRAIFERAALNLARIGRAAMSRTLCLLPTHFGHGLIGNCLTPLLAGAELFMAADSGLANAASLGAVLSERRIGFMSSVPAFWKLALRFPPPPERSLRQVSVGSAPLTAGLWRRIVGWSGTDNVANMYGLTETANWFAGASARDRAPADGLVGTPWGGTAAVLAADGAIAKIGEGELLLRSPTPMSGYYRRPELTASALAGGWYHSGDWGRIEADGTLWLAGRTREAINRAGIKVQPQEVDLLLERHPDVIEACAFAIPDAASGEIVAVAVRLAAGSATGPAELRAWCARRIRQECVPERWFVLEALPLTERGKLNRERVRDHCLGAK
jgi:acyl-CoA synthetase (AMP-forming)/AMP-acid ligase II